ncbi:MAG: hypothetical protein JWN40_1333 [Phycisphaerales bacterium]|nr:hypothetical protein [Phycisphaerales bacterium]
MSETTPTIPRLIGKIVIVILCAWNLVTGVRGSGLRPGSPSFEVLVFAALTIVSGALVMSSMRDVIKWMKQREAALAKDHRNAFEPLPPKRHE